MDIVKADTHDAANVYLGGSVAILSETDWSAEIDTDALHCKLKKPVMRLEALDLEYGCHDLNIAILVRLDNCWRVDEFGAVNDHHLKVQTTMASIAIGKGPIPNGDLQGRANDVIRRERSRMAVGAKMMRCFEGFKDTAYILPINMSLFDLTLNNWILDRVRVLPNIPVMIVIASGGWSG